MTKKLKNKKISSGNGEKRKTPPPLRKQGKKILETSGFVKILIAEGIDPKPVATKPHMHFQRKQYATFSESNMLNCMLLQN